jgi:hypothetical protein
MIINGEIIQDNVGWILASALMFFFSLSLRVQDPRALSRRKPAAQPSQGSARTGLFPP